MPTTIEIQSAIMDTIRQFIQRGRSWPATTDGGTDFTFRMDDTGMIGVYLTDEDGEEQEFCFSLEINEDSSEIGWA
jgi:hypothetical protein